jgi:hypothetical protein
MIARAAWLITALLFSGCPRPAVDPRALCASAGGRFESVAHFDSCVLSAASRACPEGFPRRMEEAGAVRCAANDW